MHSETRKRELVDKSHNMSLCISYPRLLSVSADVANSVCHMSKEQGVVCPPQLSSGVLTTTAFDIDHNSSSTTSVFFFFFHCTSITVAQHPREGQLGTKRDNPNITLLVTNQKEISSLRTSFTNSHPVVKERSCSHIGTWTCMSSNTAIKY